MHTMSDVEDESFVVLGSMPTPFMEQYFSCNEHWQKSTTKKMWTQAIPNNFSQFRADESKMTTSPKSIQSVQSASTTASINGSNAQAASFIIGETKTTSIDEIQMLQHLTNEQENVKEVIQLINVALRESLTSFQKRLEENKAEHKCRQVVMNDDHTAIIDLLKEQNDKLKQLVLAAETRATDQEKRATNLENTLERTLAELNELKKNVSEKESLLKNMAQEIERLELENRN